MRHSHDPAASRARMPAMRSVRPFVLALTLALATTSAAHAAKGMFSYDPNDEATRRLTDRGLTFVFEKGFLGGALVEQVLATEAPAAANLKPAAYRDLGVPLDSLIGREAIERDLYEVTADAQGSAMVRAWCPGSTKGWLAFGPVRVRRPLRVHVIGDDPAGGKARLCATLDLRFRGEWKLPPKATNPDVRARY